MAIINDLLENYYGLLVLVLIVAVPIWFGQFIAQAVAMIFRRWGRD